MFEKSCRCGKTKKNFKVDIGEFFINDCCTEAGYDHLGKKAIDAEDLGLNKDQLNNQLNSQETQNLQIEDEGEQPDPIEEQTEEPSQPESTEEVDMDKEVEEAIQETISDEAPAIEAQVTEEIKPEEPKKKRQYNRSGKVKIKESSES